MSSKVLVLLCYLVSNPTQQSRSKLAGLFWGEMDDQKAKSNLRQALHNLKSHLDDYIVISRQHVSFNTRLPYVTDVELLKNQYDLLQTSPPILPENEFATPGGLFLDGVDVDVTGELDDWIRTQRENYRLWHLDILEHQVQTAISQEMWQTARNALTTSISIEPLRETSYQTLMRCLARQELYGEALAVYDRCKNKLHDELGIEPSAETEKLHNQIRHAQQSEKYNISQEATPFIGRSRELDQIKDLFTSGNRLITILGQGGIGKSRLAREYGRQHHRKYLNGVYYISLVDVDSVHRIPQVIAQTMGLSFEGFEPDVKQIMALLQNLEILLILDNFEHLVDEANILSEIIKQTECVYILVTSRLRLNILSEQIYVLEGLQPSVANGGNGIPERVTFMEQAAKRHLYSIDFSHQRAELHDLCDLLNGIPLALELAAVHLPATPCSQLITSIQNDLDILSSELKDVPPNHRSMRAVLDYSWYMLSETEQNNLLRLTIFHGGFDLEAAKTITEVSGMAVKSLVDKSFISPLPRSRELHDDRYEIHEITQQYLTEKVIADGGYSTEIKDVYSSYFYNKIATSNDKLHTGTSQSGVIEALQPDIPNILSMIQHLAKWGDHERIVGSTRCLHAYYFVQGYYNEALRIFDEVIQFVEQRDLTETLAALLTQAGSLHFQLGNIDPAHQMLTQALELVSKGEPSRLMAEILNVLGAIAVTIEDYEQSMVYLQKSIEVYQHHDDLRGELRTRFTLGHVLKRQYACGEARDQFQIIVDLSYEHDYASYLILFLPELCDVLITLSEDNNVEEYLQHCYTLCEELNNKNNITLCDAIMGRYFFYRHDYRTALEYTSKAMASFNENTQTDAIIDTHILLGRTHLHLEEFDNAEQQFATVYDLLKDDQAHNKARILAYSGLLLAKQGNLPDSLTQFKHAFELAIKSCNQHLLHELFFNFCGWLSKNKYQQHLNHLVSYLSVNETLPECDKSLLIYQYGDISQGYDSTVDAHTFKYIEHLLDLPAGKIKTAIKLD